MKLPSRPEILVSVALFATLTLILLIAKAG